MFQLQANEANFSLCAICGKHATWWKFGFQNWSSFFIFYNEPNDFGRRAEELKSVRLYSRPRWAGGRRGTCACGTTPGLATAPSWSRWTTPSTSGWSPWRSGPSSSWSRPTREPAPASGTRCPAGCPSTPGNTSESLLTINYNKIK